MFKGNLYFKYSDTSDFPFYAGATETVLDLLAKFDPHRYLFVESNEPDSFSSNRHVQREQRGHVSVFSADLICVVREWRGSGLARVMVEHLTTLMRAARPTLALTVATNVRTQRLMKGRGYEVLGETRFREYVEHEELKCMPQEDDPQFIKLMVIKL